MITDHKNPSVAFWATVVLAVVLVGYPFAWGPWLWFKLTYKPPHSIRSAGDAAFGPLKWLATSGMLPEWYYHQIDKWVVAGFRVNHGPKR